MSEANEGLPEARKPRVFHHEGKRLFLIDGEPRVVDIDLASNLDREGGRYIRKLIKRHLPRLEKQGKLLCFNENGELGYGSPIQDDMLFLLKREGLVAATGVKPTIAFLNKKQARWIVAKSDTDAADDLLERLFELYDAWEDGTLEPARPAMEPPAKEAIAPPAGDGPSHDRVAVLHEGVAYQVDGDELKVVSTSLWRVADWNGVRLLDRHRDELLALAPLPVADGGKGVLLGRFQVELLGVVLERTDALFVSILDALRAHADGHLRVDGHRLAAVMPPDEVSREYAAARWPGASAPEWGAIPFLRDGADRLRVRHGRLAGWLGVSDRRVLHAIAQFRREIEAHGVMERFERDAPGVAVLGVYLTEVQASVLVEAMGLGAAERVTELFEDRIAFEVDIEVRGARDAANHEARVAAGKARPTIERVLADLALAIEGMTAAGDRFIAAGDKMTEGAAAMTAGAAAMTEVAHEMMGMIAEVRDLVRRVDATCEETRDSVAGMASGIGQLLAMARTQSRAALVSKPLRLAFWRRRSDAPSG